MPLKNATRSETGNLFFFPLVSQLAHKRAPAGRTVEEKIDDAGSPTARGPPRNTRYHINVIIDKTR